MKLRSVFKKIKEGNTIFFVFSCKKEDKGPGNKSDAPFYNPAMESNRDLSVILCQWFINNNKKDLKFVDGLAASGVRGFRLANELEGDFKIIINDWDLNAFNLIKKNFESYNYNNVLISNEDFNVLLSRDDFDYIDIDPFGSPVYYIDSAMRSIKHNGIVACTATDTATLCGVYPKVCFRRYGAVPFHSNAMKEVGLRILLGFICRTAGIYDKAIEPIVTYTSDHYFRVYVKISNSVGRTNESMKNFQTIKSGELIGYEKTKKDTGPLWMGKLQNERIIKELITILFKKDIGKKNQLWKLLDMLEEESNSPAFFYTTDGLASYFKKSVPKMSKLFEKIKSKNYNISRTHFSQTGFKTNISFNEIKKLF
jgi:tRNA (guanine26-N2/guanine27-N2)-dimethyltransferase